MREPNTYRVIDFFYGGLLIGGLLGSVVTAAIFLAASLW